MFPSEDDHVVTAPYNALLAASCLVADADCVLPIENQALADITARTHRSSNSSSRGGAGLSEPACGAGPSAGSLPPEGLAAVKSGGASGNKPWDAMNGIAADMLLHLTAGMRFEGSLNVDLNDITSNLVPFPRMHFLLSGMAPLGAPRDIGRLAAPRSMDQVGCSGCAGVATRAMHCTGSEPGVLLCARAQTPFTLGRCFLLAPLLQLFGEAFTACFTPHFIFT